MGIYYDDPYTLKNPNEFRYSAGFIIPGDAPLAQAASLIDHFLKNKYLATELPASNSVHGTFPYRMASLSYPLGAVKFYPSGYQYIKDSKQYNRLMERTLPSIEIQRDSMIFYYIPVQNCDEFRLS